MEEEEEEDVIVHQNRICVLRNIRTALHAGYCCSLRLAGCETPADVYITMSIETGTSGWAWCRHHFDEAMIVRKDPLDEPKQWHVELYLAAVRLKLTPRTLFKLGAVLCPHLYGDGPNLSSFNTPLPCVSRVHHHGVSLVRTIYLRVCERAKAAISVLWQIKQLHKDIRVLIAKRLWKTRIEWVEYM
jgi:hypothetical protein